jgi:HNH endonuclease
LHDDEHYADCYDALCECGRGVYHACTYHSCYDCFLDRRADYAQCIYCDRWHSPEFDTCFQCSMQGRDEATRDLKLVILGRDGFRCRYCSASEGELQHDPRLVRPKCQPDCEVQHNHKYACEKGCNRRHGHRNAGDHGICSADCVRGHDHLAKDDDGIRPVRLHIDHIMPCAKGGTADPWNLQVLCGVCNISKGSDWIPYSRHYFARKDVVDAYATYLWDYLTSAERGRLNSELDLTGDGWDQAHHWTAVRAVYIHGVKDRPGRRAPRSSPDVVIEDVPAPYDELAAAHGRTAS